MRVLRSKIKFELKNMTECPPFVFTLSADCISKKYEKHNGMPANFIRRQTWRNAHQFSYSACTFHFDRHCKTWRNAHQFSRTFFLCVFCWNFLRWTSRAAVEDQVGSKVDWLMVFRTPLGKWTSPLCDNPSIYYFVEVAFCENPSIYHVLSCPGVSFSVLVVPLGTLLVTLSDFSE